MSDFKTADTDLFKEFPPVTTEEWEKTITQDLKGADYKKKLRWHTGEGIQPLPFYRREDLKKLDYSAPITHTTTHPWEVRETVYGSTPQQANQAAHQALDGGADALQLRLTTVPDSSREEIKFRGLPVQTQADFSQFVKGLPLDQTLLHIDAGDCSPALLGMLWKELASQSLPSDHIRGSLLFDPWTCGLLHSSWPASRKPSDAIGNSFSFCRQNLPNFRSLGIDARIYHNSGGTIVQELGFALSAASEYLALLSDIDYPISEIAPKIHITCSAGSSYFLEIAKFRALRLLWQNLLEAFGGDPEEAPAYIHAETSRWNKTVYEPHSNMLRTSTEGMSAVLGGCDAVTVLPFDEPFRQPDRFSRRIARNSQIIMREEGYLHKVQDPAAGSYYIEQLTNDLARKAWQLFQQVEERGGMTHAVESEFVQSSIETSRQQRNQAIAKRQRVFVGTNQYPNPDERRTEEQGQPEEPSTLKTTDRNVKKEALSSIERLGELFAGGATLGDVVRLLVTPDATIETLTPYRGSESFENLRLATERNDNTPKVLNLPLGNPGIRKARSSFSNNFFGCIGYEIEDPIGFKDIPEAVEAIAKQQPDIAVLCSSDKEYERLVPKLCKQLAKLETRPLLVLAGYPEKQVEAYKQEGIDLFIYSGCNALEILKEVQQKLEIIEHQRHG